MYVRGLRSVRLIELTAMLAIAALTSEALGDRVIVGFKQRPGRAEKALVRRAGGSIGARFHIIPAMAVDLPASALAKLRTNPRVAYVEPDHPVRVVAQEVPWGIDRIDADLAWGGGYTGAGVKVAILDTGIDKDHIDLAPDPVGGVNFQGTRRDGSTKSRDWDDKNGHGTHCAGIVAAAHNSIGVAGVSYDANLYAVKVLDNSGDGNTSDIIQGIQWAVDNGMAVVSMSLGGFGNDVSLENACNEAYAQGVLLIAASGNYGDGDPGNEDTPFYPAAYGSVIAVGATDESDSVASFSQTGSWVELSAPGVNIKSLYPRDRLAVGDGTSAAAPHVSGTAALVLATNIADYPGYDVDEDGAWDASEVRARLRDVAEDLGPPGKDNGFGYGLADAYAAVETTPNQPPVADSGGPYLGSEDQPVAFDGSGSYDPDGDPLTYQWDFGDGSQGTGVDPTHTYTAGGTYTVTLVVNDGKVNSAPSTTAATIEDVVNDPPVADAGGPYSGAVGSPIALDGSGSSDEEGAELAYSWDFGDGTHGTGVNPTHTYTAAGAYTVTLVVNDGVQDSGPSTSTATIEEQPTGDMYVWDISWKYKKNLDIVVTIQWDSDGDRVGEAGDSPVDNAHVEMALTRQEGGGPWYFSGDTDSRGIVKLKLIGASKGNYTAEVTSVTHPDHPWDPSLDVDNPDSYGAGVKSGLLREVRMRRF